MKILEMYYHAKNVEVDGQMFIERGEICDPAKKAPRLLKTLNDSDDPQKELMAVSEANKAEQVVKLNMFPAGEPYIMKIQIISND